MVVVAPGGEGSVVFVPRNQDSYWYESFDCLDIATEGYTGIAFTIQGPSNGSVTLEIQTKSSCGDETSTSAYAVIDKMSGDAQEYTLSLSAFGAEANLGAVVAFVWSQFSSADLIAWTLSDIKLVCGPDIPTGGE